jgi:AcrR family transcriptional regulator
MDDSPAGRSKPQVRDRVLRAALEAIEERGPDRVRVQDIAERAGMSSGHVMYYFGDRDRILTGTLILSEENLAQRRDRAVARATDPLDAIDRVARLYLPTGPRDVRWSLWAQTIARPPTDAATRAALRDAVDAWSDCLALLVEQGVSVGDFHVRDSAATAYQYCRLMDGLAMEVLLGAPGRNRTWAVEEARLALLDLAAR